PGWRKVVDSIAELVGKHDVADGATARSTDARAPGLAVPTNRRQRILFVALTAVVLIAATAWFLASRFSHPSITTHVGASSDDRESDGTRTRNVQFAERPAVAVLPFENRSADPKDAIFADGLAEDLISRLSAWRAFPVIARGSSFRYRGDVDLGRVATELKVRYVVQGSVQRVDDRIRISVQLADAQSGANLWNR